MQDLASRLAHLVTVWDRRQEKKRGHNIYALPQYLAATDDVMTDVALGKPLENAIGRAFNDRLHDFLIRELRKEGRINAEA